MFPTQKHIWYTIGSCCDTEKKKDIIMVALRRTETYQTIRHHLRDTVIYDWLRTHTVFTYMFHLTPEGELFFRTPAPDTHIYDTPEGILTPPPNIRHP